MEKLKVTLQKHKQFLLYCICGGSGVCADYGVFHLVLDLIGVQYANMAGYLSGTLLSFVLNRAITFNMRDKTGKRLTLFLTTAAIGYVCSALMLALLTDGLHLNSHLANILTLPLTLIDGFHLDPHLSKILTLPMVVVLQFALNKRFTFKSNK